jgi:hypothetical protein
MLLEKVLIVYFLCGYDSFATTIDLLLIFIDSVLLRIKNVIAGFLTALHMILFIYNFRKRLMLLENSKPYYRWSFLITLLLNPTINFRVIHLPVLFVKYINENLCIYYRKRSFLSTIT